MGKHHIQCDCGKEYQPKEGSRKMGWARCEECLKKLDRRKIKHECIKYLGGKCIDCGYDKHDVAMDFDHKEPKAKLYCISHYLHLRWKDLVRELKKCELRCSNCHRIRHYLEEQEKRNSNK